MRPPHGRDPVAIRTRAALLAVLAALAVPVAGCGSDDELTVSAPRTTPDLTIPTAPGGQADPLATGEAAEDAPTTGTTTGDDAAAPDPATGTGGTGGTGTTGDAPGGTATGEAPAPGAETAPDEGAAGTGGAAAPDEATSAFCENNPGAC